MRQILSFISVISILIFPVLSNAFFDENMTVVGKARVMYSNSNSKTKGIAKPTNPGFVA